MLALVLLLLLRELPCAAWHLRPTRRQGVRACSSQASTGVGAQFGMVTKMEREESNDLGAIHSLGSEVFSPHCHSGVRGGHGEVGVGKALLAHTRPIAPLEALLPQPTPYMRQ
ncbi:hypothetical protein K432DRAFT_41265 [Lepidopterella palustris CBS 459.81]|uniref:Secreted protein n=1 Tax=Lepidopterella palustris CBS 459.81 TaxID=1314670 RepID=A0A8E2JFG8_9PEZI|nr:hypothetical protein K432DRAFT_41265 [Lepidopterella palustris CBS 459.81]